MPLIVLDTAIQAPVGRVFDLARSIEVHTLSVRHTRERVVAGRYTGLLDRGDRVTWQGRHFGIRQELEVRITGFIAPNFFEDTMIRGAFAFMRHRHYFQPVGFETHMRDEFEYEAPFGNVGRTVENLFLTSYMRRFLAERNGILKQVAESNAWKHYLAPEEPAAQAVATAESGRPRRPYRIAPEGIVEATSSAL